MKVEISRVRWMWIWIKYTALLIPDKGTALLQKFNSRKDLIAYLREQRERARAAGQPFEVVRKTN